MYGRERECDIADMGSLSTIPKTVLYDSKRSTLYHTSPPTYQTQSHKVKPSVEAFFVSLRRSTIT